MNRWKALFWSLGVLLTAYCTVPAADQARHHEETRLAKSHQDHRSPWAKDLSRK